MVRVKRFVVYMGEGPYLHRKERAYAGQYNYRTV